MLPAGMQTIAYSDLAHRIALALHPVAEADLEFDPQFNWAKNELANEELPTALRDGRLIVRRGYTRERIRTPDAFELASAIVLADELRTFLAERRVSLQFESEHAVDAAHPCPSVPRRLTAHAAQEGAILSKLTELGVDPLAMPRPPLGNKPWPLREQIREELRYSKPVMKKAWDRLRAARQIKDA